MTIGKESAVALDFAIARLAQPGETPAETARRILPDFLWALSSTPYRTMPNDVRKLRQFALLGFYSKRRLSLFVAMASPLGRLDPAWFPPSRFAYEGDAVPPPVRSLAWRSFQAKIAKGQAIVARAYALIGTSLFAFLKKQNGI